MVNKNIKWQFIFSISIFMLMFVYSNAQVGSIQKQDLKEFFKNSMNNKDLSVLGKTNTNKGELKQSKSEFQQLITILNKNTSNLKSGKSAIDVLDIIYTNKDKNFRDLYGFDGNGNQTSVMFYETDTVTGNWSIYGRFVFTYDSDGNQLTSIAEPWDRDSAKWDDFNHVTYNYDNNGNKLSSYQKAIDKSGSWVNTVRKTYTYDANGNTLTDVHANWNNSNEGWEVTYGVWMEFDIKDNFLSKKYKEWKGSYWGDLQFYEYTYDVNSFLIETKFSRWTGSAWLKYTKFTHTNNVFGDETKNIAQSWNNTDSTWVNNNSSLKEYDDGRNLLESTAYSWSGTEWINGGRQIFTYDNFNNRLSFTLESWSAADLKWVNALQYTYTYNEDGNITHLEPKQWEGSDWESYNAAFWFIIKGERYNYEGSDLKVYYFNTPIEEQKDKVSNFTLSQNFPNPFNASTEIQYTLKDKGFVSLTVYDIMGRAVSNLVNENQVEGNYSVVFTNSSMLQRGTYFYTLKINNRSLTKKLVLNK